MSIQRDELVITRSGDRQARKDEPGASGQRIGCGNSITWSTMAPVPVPGDLCATHEVNVNDISSLPSEVAPNWDQKFEDERAKFKVQEEESLPFPVEENEAYRMDEYAFDFRNDN